MMGLPCSGAEDTPIQGPRAGQAWAPAADDGRYPRGPVDFTTVTVSLLAMAVPSGGSVSMIRPDWTESLGRATTVNMIPISRIFCVASFA